MCWETGRLVKKNNFVEFENRLSLNDFLTPGNKVSPLSKLIPRQRNAMPTPRNCVCVQCAHPGYSLCSVLVHEGKDLNGGGHYFAYVKVTGMVTAPDGMIGSPFVEEGGTAVIPPVPPWCAGCG